jgi:hypothetical protein
MERQSTQSHPRRFDFALDRLAGCFINRRSQSSTEHTVRTLLGQRVLGIAAG